MYFLLTSAHLLHSIVFIVFVSISFPYSCVQLNFQGVTVERDQPYLHFDSHQHFFTSVTVGDCSPPKQVCVLCKCVQWEDVYSPTFDEGTKRFVIVCLPCRCMNYTMVGQCRCAMKWTQLCCHSFKLTTLTIQCCAATIHKEKFLQGKPPRWNGSSHR